MEFFEIDETFVGLRKPTTTTAAGKGVVKEANPIVIYTDYQNNYGTLLDDGKTTVSWQGRDSGGHSFNQGAATSNGAAIRGYNAMAKTCKNLQ